MTQTVILQIVFSLCVRDYMESHGSLRFMGLSLTKACEYSMFSTDSIEYNSEITVSMNLTSCLVIMYS